MTKFLAIFDVLPGAFYALVIVLLLALGVTTFSMQNTSIADAKLDLAELNRKVEKERADRGAVIAAHNLEVAALQAAHAKVQQENVDGYVQKLRDAEVQHASELAAVREHADRGVHDAAERAAARDRQAARDNPASCGDLADRNATLYGLLAEGHQLVVEQQNLAVEGRAIVRRRDAEVATLMNVIQNDRTAICASTK